MSLLLITNPPTVLTLDSQWTDLVLRSNANMLGHGLSIPIFTLTNWDATTTIPQIAQGSIIEVGGSFYQADVDTALTPEGGIIDGTVHIKLVPSGGGASVVPTLTNDAIPAWDALKAGWYTSDDKFLPFEMTKATAVYTVKSEFIDQNKTIKISTVGDIVLASGLITDAVTEKTALAGITFNSTIKKTKAILVTTAYQTPLSTITLYNDIAATIEIGETMLVSGMWNSVGTGGQHVVSHITRTSATIVTLYATSLTTGGLKSLEIDGTVGLPNVSFSLAW